MHRWTGEAHYPPRVLAQRACRESWLGKFQGSQQRLSTRRMWRHAGHVGPRGKLQLDDWYSRTRSYANPNFSQLLRPTLRRVAVGKILRAS